MEVVIRMLDGSIPYHLTGLIPPPRDAVSGRDWLSCSDSACFDVPALTDRPRPSESQRRWFLLRLRPRQSATTCARRWSARVQSGEERGGFPRTRLF
jgi:hypothetical protein